jgi:uncharacterized cupin superfamily protein
MKKVNLNDIPWRERKSPAGKYHRFLRDVALAFQSPKTGPKPRWQPPFEVELVRLPPNARNFPFHSHATEWEFYLIVSGTGKMRAGRKTTSLKPGDCILNPPGEPHQIINTGRKDLHYYVIANNASVDIWHYPDSSKWGWTVGRGDFFFRKSAIEYYEGEE